MSHPLAFLASDLASGDAASAALDLSSFRFDRIRSIDDPCFDMAHAELWREFGAKNEMERRETLALRFGLAPRILYEMILVRRGAEFIGVRDHTAIVSRDGTQAVVHLSHNLLAPAARRTGLGGWMRAFPIQTARECLARKSTPITLAAEMEHDDGSDPQRTIRLRAYEKAGFVKIDQQFVDFHQPDFRAPAEIDATGGAQPVRFQLVIRRVGREHETTIRGVEIRALVQSLYDIYGPQFRRQDMAHPLLDPARLPADDAIVPLLPPTQC
ncbi:MAG: hypothetical protein ABIZ56_10250 [Chthoniobacteraceae bacterium]